MVHLLCFLGTSQPAITCSKLTIETLKQEQVKSRHQNKSLLLTYFTSCSSVSIINFEQVNADWVQPTSKNCMFLVDGFLNLFIPGQPRKKIFFYGISIVSWVCINHKCICHTLVVFDPHFPHCSEGNNH